MKGEMNNWNKKQTRKEDQSLFLYKPAPFCPAFHFFAISPLFNCTITTPLFNCMNGENTQKLSSAVEWCSEARGNCYQISCQISSEHKEVSS